MEKLLPQNNEAEVGALGSLLIDPAAYAEVAEFLKPDDFYREAHRDTYAVICDLHATDRPADLITLTDELARRGKLETAGGLSYISSLANAVPTSANIVYYARIVERCALLRRLIHAAGQIAAVAYNEPEADVAVTKAFDIVYAATERRIGAGFIDGGATLDATMTDLGDRMDAPEKTRVQTGIWALDQSIMGLEPGELAIICGRPGDGKSMVAENMALNMAKAFYAEGHGSVAYLTLEMSNIQQMQRMLAAEAEVNTRIIRAGFRKPNGEIDDDAREAVEEAYRRLRPMLDRHLRLKETGTTVPDFRALLTHEVARRECRVAFVDQVDLFDDDREGGYEKEHERLGRYSKALKQMAKALSIPIVLLVQLNRDSERVGRLTLSNLAGSDRWGRDADFVFWVTCDASADEERARTEPIFREYGRLGILKARSSDKGGEVSLLMQWKYAKVSDWPTYPPHSSWLAQYKQERSGADSRPRRARRDDD